MAVLGIALASYIALCSRAMKLSNRSYQDALSRQLAEFGLEEGLRAFNEADWNDWANAPAGITAGSWSLNSATKRATRTITFDSSKIGQGNTATVKVRVDNYDASILGTTTWNSSRTYGANELVEYNGEWYRSTKGGNISGTPSPMGNKGNWAPEPFPWAWHSNENYQQNVDVVCEDGNWYRCASTHITTASSTPPTASDPKWTQIPPPELGMVSGTLYTTDQYVYSAEDQTWYRCLISHTFSGFISANWEAVSGASTSAYHPPWAYRTSVSYTFNDVVYYNGVWYRYINPTPSSNAPTNPTYWENALSGMFGWNSSGTKYNLGDIVYAGSRWYRCIKSHSSSGSTTPATSPIYWATTPSYSTAWDAARSYSAGDLVRYNGLWYRCLQGNTGISITDSGYWANPLDSFFTWSRSTSYGVGSTTRYGGAWYTCILGNTGVSPNDATYWTATRGNSAGISTGATVVYAEATIDVPGGRSVQTQLRALLQPAALFPNALGATGPISLGSGGTIDSYATNPISNIPTWGFSAVVASTQQTSTAVTAVKTIIKGFVAAPPGTSAPLASFGSNAEVKGSAATPSPTKADPARLSRSPFVPQFDPLPANGLSANWSTLAKGTLVPSTGTVNLGTPGATVPSRYYCSSLTIDNSNISALNIDGPVILYISGNLTVGSHFTNNSANRVTIASTGSVEIHVGGSMNVTQNGGGFDNQTKDPRKLILICDSSGTSAQTYSDGDNDFYGVIYAPNTASLDGFLVGNSSTVIFGAVSAKKITFTNDANVHYDTSLRSATFGGVEQPYTITELRELPATERATMP